MHIIKTETVKKGRLKYTITTFKTADYAYKHMIRLQKRNISCAVDGVKVVTLATI